MTHSEANEILNKFVGWTPGQKCDGDKGCAEPSHHVIGSDERLKHMSNDIPPIDYFADTPEAREAAEKLEDEFIERTNLTVRTCHYKSDRDRKHVHVAWIDGIAPYINAANKHCAVALAIAKALKENRK